MFNKWRKGGASRVAVNVVEMPVQQEALVSKVQCLIKLCDMC